MKTKIHTLKTARDFDTLRLLVFVKDRKVHIAEFESLKERSDFIATNKVQVLKKLSIPNTLKKVNIWSFHHGPAHFGMSMDEFREYRAKVVIDTLKRHKGARCTAKDELGLSIQGMRDICNHLKRTGYKLPQLQDGRKGVPFTEKYISICDILIEKSQKLKEKGEYLASTFYFAKDTPWTRSEVWCFLRKIKTISEFGKGFYLDSVIANCERFRREHEDLRLRALGDIQKESAVKKNRA